MEILLFLVDEAPTSGYQIWALDERRGLFRQPPAEPIQLTKGHPMPLPGVHLILGRTDSQGRKKIFAWAPPARRAFPHRPADQRNQAVSCRHFRR